MVEGHLSSARGEREGGLYWAHFWRQHPLFTDQIPPALMPLWRQQTNRTAGRWGKTGEAQRSHPHLHLHSKENKLPKDRGPGKSFQLPWAPPLA